MAAHSTGELPQQWRDLAGGYFDELADAAVFDTDALVEQKQCGGLQTPMGPSRETLHVFKILREEARGKRPENVDACIIQEVCSEGIHPSPDFQQLLWLLHSRQGLLCSTAFRMMEDI